MTDSGLPPSVAPALVELLPRVVHDSPAAVLLVELNSGTVTYANRQAVAMAPGARLPLPVNEWSDAAGLHDPDGQSLSDTGSPLSRIAAGKPVDGEPVNAARAAGPVPAREPLWVTGFPLVGATGLANLALVVFFELAGATGQVQEVGEALTGLRDRAVLATDIAFTISDPDQPDNPLIWANPAFTRITGYEFEDVLGTNCRFLQGPATDPQSIQALREAIATQQSTTVTLINYRKDGTAFWNEVSLSPVFDGDGRLTNFVGVQSDVTARVQAEADREAAYRAAGRAQARLTLIAEISASLSATLDVGEALDRLAGHLVPTFADWCALDLIEPQGVRRVAVAHRDPDRVDVLFKVPPIAGPRRRSPVATVLDTGRPLLFDRVDEEQLAKTGGPPDRIDLMRSVGVSSGIVVPLQARNRVLGAVSLGLVDGDRRYDDADLQLATDLGRRAGLAIDNAWLYSREHEVAVALQRAMLPPIVDLPGVRVSAHYLAGSDRADVGGDWYDVLGMPGDVIGIAIGDVMGHDLIAAAAMGQLRSVLRSYAWEGHSPAEVLDRLDRLVQGLGMAQLATCVYGCLEAAEGGATLRYANAGHLPPVLQLPDGSVRVLRDGKSVLIGAPGHPRRVNAEVFVPYGATLVLYTDGLVEDRIVDVDSGIEQLSELVAAHRPDLGVDSLCERLLAGLLRGPREDDAALIAIQLTEDWGKPA